MLREVTEKVIKMNCFCEYFCFGFGLKNDIIVSVKVAVTDNQY